MKADAIRFLGQWRRAEVLEFLATQPARQFTINALAKEAGLPVSTVWHAVRDLAAVGYVTKHRIGGAVGVAFNAGSPAAKAFAGVSLQTPHRMAYDAFVKILQRKAPGLETRLFGSVARGEEKPASDVDVQVAYGDSGLNRDQVYALCARASNEVLDSFGIMVSALILPQLVVIP